MCGIFFCSSFNVQNTRQQNDSLVSSPLTRIRVNSYCFLLLFLNMGQSTLMEKLFAYVECSYWRVFQINLENYGEMSFLFDILHFGGSVFDNG